MLLETIAVYKMHCPCSEQNYNAIMPPNKDVNAHTQSPQKCWWDPTEPTHKNISAIVCTSFSVRFWKICLEPIDSSIPSDSQFAKYFELVPSVAFCGSKPSRKYHVSRDRCLRRCGTVELSFGIASGKRGLFCGLGWGPGKTTLERGLFWPVSPKTTLAYVEVWESRKRKAPTPTPPVF